MKCTRARAGACALAVLLLISGSAIAGGKKSRAGASPKVTAGGAEASGVLPKPAHVRVPRPKKAGKQRGKFTITSGIRPHLSIGTGNARLMLGSGSNRGGRRRYRGY
jgi:hypothetical protein